MNRAFATLHKNTFDRLVAAAGIEITIRQPSTRAGGPSSAAEKALGRRAEDTGYGDSDEVVAIVTNSIDATASPESNAGIKQSEPIGLYQISDVVIRLKLSDVLIDSNKPQGLTLFDTAKDVLIQGTPFKVCGSERTGFAPIGPYILWVGLKSLGK